MNARCSINPLTKAILSLAVAGALAAPSAVAAGADLARGRLVVKFAPQVSEQEVARVLKGNMCREIGRNDRIGVRSLEVPEQLEESLALSLSKDPRVLYAQAEGWHAPTTMTPNDVYYGYAWHLPKIGAPNAWDFSLGADVTVAVVDSGVDGTHPDLAGRMVAGWNVVSNSDDTSDVFGHGTHVAGVIAADTDNSIGAAGLTWGSSLMPVRITNDATGVALSYDVANGILWATDHGAKVINVSYAMTGIQVVTDAAVYARAHGAVVVMPSGNDGLLQGLSDVPSVITVGATDSTDAVPSWSNRGNHIDLVAPGLYLMTLSNGGGYTTSSGTSVAAPVVAGVAALMMSANADLTAEAVEQILESTAVDIGTAGWDQSAGAGRVNAEAAVQAALAWTPAPLDQLAPTVAIASPAAGGTVSGTVPVQVNASDNVGVTSVELYAGATLIGTLTAAPYTFSLNTTGYANGALALTAHAFDAAGNEAMSSTVDVTVYNAPADTTPPTAQVLTPTANKTVSGNVSITSTASDNVAVATMTLYVDNVQLCTGTSTTLSCTWNSTSAARGYHYIKLIAADTSGNTASNEVRVKR